MTLWLDGWLSWLKAVIVEFDFVPEEAGMGCTCIINGVLALTVG